MCNSRVLKHSDARPHFLFSFESASYMYANANFDIFDIEGINFTYFPGTRNVYHVQRDILMIIQN